MKIKTSKFLIVSAVIHKRVNDKYAGYTPYIREMNLWLKYVEKVRVIAPVNNNPVDPLETFYNHPGLHFVSVPAMDFTSVIKAMKSFFFIPLIIFRIFQGMVWASHIHLRCPANIGLLGAFAQILFPFKYKTVKYANNWDWNSSQPLSYRIQQRILRNTFITKNTRVLVYGDWNEKSPNIYPFFTASYTNENKVDTPIREIKTQTKELKLLFVGTLTDNKRPLECIKTIEILNRKGIKTTLDLIGDGFQRTFLEEYVLKNSLNNIVKFHGKKGPGDVTGFFRNSHILIFLSKSEGWPKVVAESMWWGCLPVTTNVSCVSQMVGNMERGILVNPEPEIVAESIVELLKKPGKYAEMCQAAMEWSREYTLEKFEDEIVKLLNNK